MGCSSSSPKGEDAARNEKILQLFMTQVDAAIEQDTLDMRGLVVLLWKARDKPEFARIVTDLLVLHAYEANSFRGIEFYLPQLAHMLVHLEVDWPEGVLEMFTLFIAQQSLHIALQLSWILTGLMEDYQPEDSEGKRNPTANLVLYNRCARLLEKLELSVVYGTPFNESFLQLFKDRKISYSELLELENGDRKFQALNIAEKVDKHSLVKRKGSLEYMRWKKRGGLHRNTWITRDFIIAHRVLYCFRKGQQVVKRSIPLDQCRVVVPDTNQFGKPFYFELHEIDRERKYLLSASSKDDMDEWIRVIEEEIQAPPKDYETKKKPDGEAEINLKPLSTEEIARYGFYRTERSFVRTLTDICEELRFVEIPKRKEELREKLRQLSIPGCVYVPLCGSTDPWERVVGVVPEKSSAFSTRERCPCLMTFEVTSDDPEQAQDTATYLYQNLGFPTILDDAEVEELEQVHSSSSIRALKRNEFVRSARNSVTSMDLGDIQSAISEDQGGDLGVKRRSSTVDIEPVSLWTEIGPKRHEEEKSTHPNRRLWRSTALKLDAVHLLMKGARGEYIPEFYEKEGELAKKSKSLGEEESQLIERPAKGKYLAALGKYMYVESNASAANLTTNSTTPADSRPEPTESTDAEDTPVFLKRIIAKSNDDLRQEVFTMQLIQFLHDIWLDKGLKLYVNPYRILSTAQTCGLIELLENSNSFDGVKKDNDRIRIGDFLKKQFPDQEEFKRAQLNFIESMAGYSLVTYILGIKDRHNGNMMLNLKTGHVTHIDFGFVLGMAPGKDKVKHTNFSLERAAFKLTPELVEAMGGKKSQNWEYFNRLLVEGVLEARKHCETIITLIEITGYRSKLPCFNQPGGGVARVIREIKERLMIGKSVKTVEKKVRALAAHASNSRLTLLYEKFQKRSNNIEPCL